ncbi:hypothetical protein HYFRA_00003267 [Hymenoscyphus fraxineus]|uniref:Allergen Asp f 4 n=1 Tax=Hymenoscyphus fraxineus TaxID=746836 RepID=A0A9N9KW43_9HELO|nr:hypothetical protein HYFRA_00003267 [Hymenoscyphus fraxineus]
MRYSTATALFVAAMSASDAMAGPAHAHLHQRIHQKRNVDWKNVDYSKIDFSKLDVDWVKAYAKGLGEKGSTISAADLGTSLLASKPKLSASPSPSPSPTKDSEKGDDDKDDKEDKDDKDDKEDKDDKKPAKPTATPKPSSGDDDVGELLGGVVGVSNDRKKFGGKSTQVYALGDFAENNVGSPYGSNVMKVDKIGDYPFTITFTNPQKKAITINLWNKKGPDMATLSGSTAAPKDTTLTFVLKPGSEQVVAVDENSNIAWAEATTKLRKDSGQFDTSFGEVTFLAKGSGYNLSAIPNTAGNKYDMSISSKEVKCVSDMTQNYWLTPTQPIGTSDGSCYIPDATATLRVVMAGNA